MYPGIPIEELEEVLTDIDYAILSACNLHPMGVGGYDLEVMSGRVGGLRGCSVSYGYSRIKELAEGGLLLPLEFDGKRPKTRRTTYALTSKGREILSGHAETPIGVPDVTRAEVIPRLRAHTASPWATLEGFRDLHGDLRSVIDDDVYLEARWNKKAVVPWTAALEADLRQSLLSAYHGWVGRVIAVLEEEVKERELVLERGYAIAESRSSVSRTRRMPPSGG